METNAPETAAPSPDAPGEPPVPAAPPPAEAATEPQAPEDAPIAPGVERMLAPTGTAKKIPETLLGPQPSAAFLLVVAVVSLVADVASKLWAEANLAGYPGYLALVEGHLQLVLAKNPGGAWGLLQSQHENVRRPFFLLVSVAAITFIVTLYKRLQPNQHALRWGLPLVLGGALGNVFDRIRYGYVIDFIDYRADWVRAGNELVHKYSAGHVVTDHWPTFNIADVAICVGVGLMAVDMLTAKRQRTLSERLAADVPVTEVAEVPAPVPAPDAPETPSADVTTAEAPPAADAPAADAPAADDAPKG